MNRVFDAIEFASKAHRGQFRKGTRVPYIVHPIGVMKILIECGADEDTVIAGILHDVVEDTPVTLEEIKKAFGYKVARIVKGASEPEKSEAWEKRKLHTIENLKSAEPNVLIVEIADKLDNIRSIQEDYRRLGESFWNRFNRPKSSQKWYYESLLEVFLSRKDETPCTQLVYEFEKIVKEIFDWE